MVGDVWIHSLFGVSSGGYAATSGAAEGLGHGPGAFVALGPGFEFCGGRSDHGDAFRRVEEVVAVKASCWASHSSSRALGMNCALPNDLALCLQLKYFYMGPTC